MLTPPRLPNPGEPITASFMRELVRYMVAITPKPGPNVRISQGPNGSVIDVEAAAAATDRSEYGRYAITKFDVETIDETKTATVKFKNCYIRIGGKTVRPDSDEQTLNNFTGGFIAVVVSASDGRSVQDIESFKTFEELAAAESDASRMVIPIYKFNEDLGFECDFRLGPEGIMGEPIE